LFVHVSSSVNLSLHIRLPGGESFGVITCVQYHCFERLVLVWLSRFLNCERSPVCRAAMAVGDKTGLDVYSVASVGSSIAMRASETYILWGVGLRGLGWVFAGLVCSHLPIHSFVTFSIFVSVAQRQHFLSRVPWLPAGLGFPDFKPGGGLASVWMGLWSCLADT